MKMKCLGLLRFLNVINFLLDYQYDEDNLCSVSDSGNLVSLEEDEVKSTQKVFYDNVIDILSDEELDSM